MYLHIEAACQDVEKNIAQAKNMDPRVAEFLLKDFLAYVKRTKNYHTELVIGSTAKFQNGIQHMCWADAPESLRQAVMNGEELLAINPVLFSKILANASKYIKRYVIKGSGKDFKSISGHSVESMEIAYSLAKRTLKEKRRDRLAKNQMFVIHEEGDCQIVFLAGNAALGVVGTALRNCVRDAYQYTPKGTGSIQRNLEALHRENMYFGFRDTKTGRWTSLADCRYDRRRFYPNRADVIAALSWQSHCHEPLENNSRYWNKVDQDLWKRLWAKREFNTAIHQAYCKYHVNKVKRMDALNLLLSKTRPMSGSVDVDELISRTRTVTGRLSPRDYWNAARGDRYMTFHDFEGILNLDSLQALLGVGDRTPYRDDRFQTFTHMYGQPGTQLIMMPELPVETFTDNAASAAFGRTNNQLQMRQAQRARVSKDRAIPGLLRGLVTRAS